jgi:hypothetical protein
MDLPQDQFNLAVPSERICLLVNSHAGNPYRVDSETEWVVYILSAHTSENGEVAWSCSFGCEEEAWSSRGPCWMIRSVVDCQRYPYTALRSSQGRLKKLALDMLRWQDLDQEL